MGKGRIKEKGEWGEVIQEVFVKYGVKNHWELCHLRYFFSMPLWNDDFIQTL